MPLETTHRAVCDGGCGAAAGPLPFPRLVGELGRLGWEVQTQPSRYLCPACVGREKEMRRQMRDAGEELLRLTTGARGEG